MKRLNFFYLLLTVLLVSVAFTACDDDDDDQLGTDTVPSALLGTWSVGSATTLTFNADGTGTLVTPYGTDILSVEVPVSRATVTANTVSYAFRYGYTAATNRLTIAVNGDTESYYIDTLSETTLVLVDGDDILTLTKTGSSSDTGGATTDDAPELLYGTWGYGGVNQYTFASDGTVSTYSPTTGSVLSTSTWTYTAASNLLTVAGSVYMTIVELTEDHLIYSVPDDEPNDTDTYILFRSTGETWTIGDLSLLVGKTWKTYNEALMTITFNSNGTGLATYADDPTETMTFTYTLDATNNAFVITYSDDGVMESGTMYLGRLTENRFVVTRSVYSDGDVDNDPVEFYCE